MTGLGFILVLIALHLQEKHIPKNPLCNINCVNMHINRSHIVVIADSNFGIISKDHFTLLLYSVKRKSQRRI